MEKFVTILVVGTGGFIGAVSRYTITGMIHRITPLFLPAGTLVVNVIGCLVIGILMSFVASRELVNDQAKLFLITGFLGSLTTFSTFGYETVDLLNRQKLPGLAFLNVAGNVILGLLAVWLGHQLFKLIAGS
ncbi:Fluoride ion transporter CrcB [hydrothermal vent metagenome]|uniref:Fluoride ion transporter CrcB n=1 Tax=hydrothermal vent metagenome TaxID=652676 RepID=A0A3B1DFA4_9ZZZZ